MEDHPIQGLMKTAMENIKDMVDVNTIIGDPVETQDGHVIIPVSRVSFGFAAGGTEFEPEKDDKRSGARDGSLPFGGGSGGGVSVSPVAFLVVGNGKVRLLPVDRNAMLDRLLDVVPGLLGQIQDMTGGNGKSAEKLNYQI